MHPDDEITQMSRDAIMTLISHIKSTTSSIAMFPRKYNIRDKSLVNLPGNADLD